MRALMRWATSSETPKVARGIPVAIVGENDADVCHGGLGEDAGDVVMLERAFERAEIVEFDDAGGFGGIDGRADIAAAGADHAIFEPGKRFIHGAVVTVVEHKDFRTLRDFTGDANGEAIGVGGAESKLPVGETEAALEIFTDPEGVFGGAHESDAYFDAARDSFGDDFG